MEILREMRNNGELHESFDDLVMDNIEEIYYLPYKRIHKRFFSETLEIIKFGYRNDNNNLWLPYEKGINNGIPYTIYYIVGKEFAYKIKINGNIINPMKVEDIKKYSFSILKIDENYLKRKIYLCGIDMEEISYRNNVRYMYEHKMNFSDTLKVLNFVQKAKMKPYMVKTITDKSGLSYKHELNKFVYTNEISFVDGYSYIVRNDGYSYIVGNDGLNSSINISFLSIVKIFKHNYELITHIMTDEEI